MTENLRIYSLICDSFVRLNIEEKKRKEKELTTLAHFGWKVRFIGRLKRELREFPLFIG
jgi:hypothetical protein